MVGGIGDPAEDRTRDLRIKSPLLYQLSYRVGRAKVRAPRSAAQARLTSAGAGLAFYRRMSPRIVPVSADTPITHVSDTARWVAMYRAWESERPDALFHDPYARRLAGPQGETIVRTMPKARTWAWPMVVRTCLFDELILRDIERDGVGTVLNLGAGLDARPWRAPLSPAVRWRGVELADVVALSKQQLAS